MFSAEDLIFLPAENVRHTVAAGSFARRIIVLVRSGNDYPGQKEFLVKILAAAHINLEKDTLLAEISGAGAVSLISLLHEKQPEHILVFGLAPSEISLAIEAPLYKPLEFYGTTWLFAESLSVLEPDKTRKGLLWRALQQLFL